MNEFWQRYSEKFQAITTREQMLVLMSGAIAITFILFSLFVDANLVRSNVFTKDIAQLEADMRAKAQTIDIFQQALSEDPNKTVTEQISQYESKLGQVDVALLSLTSDLIDPIQMRFALIDLLKLQKGVSLLTFDVIAAQPISLVPNSNTTDSNGPEAAQAVNNNEATSNEIPSLTLYKHGIKLTLSGSYFQLRDYLSMLEQLKWTFFWHKFDYKLKEYPQSVLEVELYSLSTKREFIGV
ncbi:hypothetical protein [Thalassotalea piscium]|uniref:MSHA biogenesis protein MshJ n=1 Tax=Thalassotalea piscium TaxID=1230533 RepID=A0A7X0NJJ1_9GAMM|nr:hypothetical protein [Thalassotalea piscium]MBB6544617.1 MSHA biogenesis protein MshJ [Thalassotalea piscium]